MISVMLLRGKAANEGGRPACACLLEIGACLILVSISA